MDFQMTLDNPKEFIFMFMEMPIELPAEIDLEMLIGISPEQHLEMHLEISPNNEIYSRSIGVCATYR